MKVIAYFAALVIGASVHSQTLLIPTRSVSPEEFASAKSGIPETQGYMDHHKAETPELENIEKLNQLFASAQASFVSFEDKLVMQKRFESVVLLENEDDWDLEQQKIFYMSYLRLLQITADASESNAQREEWMRSVLFYLNHIPLPEELIPPPIVGEIQSYKEKQPLHEIHFHKELNREFQQILIQGFVYSPKMPLLLKDKSKLVRVSYISDHLVPVTKIMSLAEISSFAPMEQSLADGNCAQPSLTKKITFNRPTEIYRPLSCSKETNLAAPPQEKEILLDAPPPPEQLKISGSQKWWWIGAGILASAIVIHQSNKAEKPSHTPTESHGF